MRTAPWSWRRTLIIKLHQNQRFGSLCLKVVCKRNVGVDISWSDSVYALRCGPPCFVPI